MAHSPAPTSAAAPIPLQDLGLSDAEEQIIGKPWNYQQKFDAKLFAKSTEWARDLYKLPEGVCEL